MVRPFSPGVLDGEFRREDAVAKLYWQPPAAGPATMGISVDQLVERIHATPVRIVLSCTGGGSGAIADLLEVPGASRTLIEAVVPYSPEALAAWLGGQPEGACSADTARSMAVAAFFRALTHVPAGGPLAGAACTAALATDRPRRGEHRAHAALQTIERTAEWSLQLEKGRRNRAEEERLVSRLLLSVVAAACGLPERLELELTAAERIESAEAVAPAAWQQLMLGNTSSACHGPAVTAVVFPGAFHPLHHGHRRMIEVARQVLGQPVAAELSIENVDKPPLDYIEIDRRLRQFPGEQTVWLSRAPTFAAKARMFPGATFVVGTDTLRRIAEPRYYGDERAGCLAAIEQIAQCGCRFLVFGRDLGDGFVRLGDLDLPEPLRAICREVPPEVFREDISSTEIRRRES